MKYTSIIAIGLALTAALSAAPANALSGRTFVSPTGSDSNPCTLALPCRNLQAALYQTNPGGEIAILGTAGYSGGATFTIDRAISIANPGAFEAGISVPASGTAIVINAGPNDDISLRGLNLEGAGVASVGIQFNSGRSLRVHNSFVRGFTNAGLLFAPTVSGALFVSNTLVSDSAYGIRVLPTGSSARATASISRSEIANNATGFSADTTLTNATGGSPVDATISDTVITNNSNIGVIATAGTGTSQIALTSSQITYNGTGIYTLAGSASGIIYIGTALLRGNVTSIVIGTGCVVRSYGNNMIDDNGGGSYPNDGPIALH